MRTYRLLHSTDPPSRGRVRPIAATAMLGCWLVAASAARADFFTFVTTASPLNTVTANGVTITLTPQSVNTPGNNLDATPTGTDIVFGAISVSGLTLSSPLEAVNIPYSFDVTITDYALGNDNIPTGPAVVFNIAGTLSGSVGAGRKVNIANVFSQSSIIQFVGGVPYQLNLFSYVPPGIANSGAFGAHVEVVPEPSGWLLLGAGLLALAIPAYWRRIVPRTGGTG